MRFIICLVAVFFMGTACVAQAIPVPEAPPEATGPVSAPWSPEVDQMRREMGVAEGQAVIASAADEVRRLDRINRILKGETLPPDTDNTNLRARLAAVRKVESVFALASEKPLLARSIIADALNRRYQIMGVVEYEKQPDKATAKIAESLLVLSVLQAEQQQKLIEQNDEIIALLKQIAANK